MTRLRLRRPQQSRVTGTPCQRNDAVHTARYTSHQPIPRRPRKAHR